MVVIYSSVFYLRFTLFLCAILYTRSSHCRAHIDAIVQTVPTAASSPDEYIVDSATIYATVRPDHISIANYSAPADKHSIKVHSYK